MAKEAFGKEHNAQRLAAFWFSPEDLNIAMDPKDPLYDSRAMEKVDEDFVNTIVEGGIIQPICITKRDDSPWVVTGRRRTLGARQANVILASMGQPPVKVPCTYKRATEERLMRDIIIENEHRKADNVIQKAEKAQRLIDSGYGVSDIAPMFGVSTQTINKWLSYLELPKNERDAIIAGEQSAHGAVKKQREKSGVRAVTMKKKKEIREKIKTAEFCGTDYDDGFAAALRWVLGDKND